MYIHMHIYTYLLTLLEYHSTAAVYSSPSQTPYVHIYMYMRIYILHIFTHTPRISLNGRSMLFNVSNPVGIYIYVYAYIHMYVHIYTHTPRISLNGRSILLTVSNPVTGSFWWKFSNVSVLLNLLYKTPLALTFENFSQTFSSVSSLLNVLITSLHPWNFENSPRNFKSQLATGWRRVIGCIIFIGPFPQKSHKIDDTFAERELQLGVRQVEGLWPRQAEECQPTEQPRATGVGSEPLRMLYPMSCLFPFFFDISRLRRSISNWTSPPDMQFQIGRLLV